METALSYCPKKQQKHQYINVNTITKKPAIGNSKFIRKLVIVFAAKAYYKMLNKILSAFYKKIYLFD